MTDRETARKVHTLLLEAHPEAGNVNLAEASHLAETAGVPSDDLQLETFVAIRNVRRAIDNGERSRIGTATNARGQSS
jgi:hypothetical protein